ncbi:MAG: hypothetical protein CMM94_06895 [Rickettsiales bacterium]|nr:hypothetical protein [Rickettsiales bacterium]
MLAIAHRGAETHFPENTLSAFEKAIELGADAIELDAHVCMSGEPVVMHDNTIDRTTSRKGKIAKMNLAQLEALDAGDGKGVPSLIKALNLVNRRCKVFIEVKDVSAALPIAKVVQYCVDHKGWSYSELPIVSFFHQALAMIHEKHPKIITGASVHKVPESLAACAEFTDSHYFLPRIDALTEELVADARMRKVKIIAWTARDEAEVEQAKQFDIDGIIAADPSWV